MKMMQSCTHSDRVIVISGPEGDEVYEVSNVADFIPDEMIIDMLLGPPESVIGRCM